MANQSGMAVRTLFGLLGLVVALFGGWQAYDRTQSVVLAVFVGLLALNYIGRGIADVFTDPQKGRRFLFFTIPPIFARAEARRTREREAVRPVRTGAAS